MNAAPKKQQGISAIGLIIILAIIAAGTYIGLQYIPRYIEAGTVDSILANLEKAHEETPFGNAADITKMINKQLTLNQMDDLRDSFRVMQDSESFTVRVNYERELDLVYRKQPMPYDRTLTLH